MSQPSFTMTFRDDEERRSYEHCRDNLFPLLKELKAKARKKIEAKRKADERRLEVTFPDGVTRKVSAKEIKKIVSGYTLDRLVEVTA